MANRGRPVPEGFHTLTPYLVIAGASRAIDFYKQAFGAKERFRMPGPDGRIMHAELQVGDSRLLLCDEMPEMGGRSPQTLKGSPVSLFLYVPDVDATFKQAVAAGAQEKAPVSDMFWGDRWGAVVDPFGHEWQIATHKEDLSPEEMGKRAAAAFSAQK
jgi:PhnB protein